MPRILSKIFLLVSILFCNNQESFSQNKDSIDPVSIKTYIAGRGAAYYKNAYENDSNNYFAVIIVTNNQDTVISFLIWNQSWLKDNIVIDNDSIYLKFWGNDGANGPAIIKLQPHKSVHFNTVIRARNENIANRYFKTGFCFSEIKDFAFIEKRKKRSSGKIYCSNTLKLEYLGSGYEIDN